MEKVRKLIYWMKKLFCWIIGKPFEILNKILIFLGKAISKREESSCWFNIASLLTGFAAFEVYRSLSFSDAEYQGELFLYIFAKSAPYIIWGVIIWEFLCLVGLRRWKNAGIQILKMWRWLKSRFSKMLVKTKLVILCCGIGFVILSGMGVYNYFNKCDTEYYESIAEFYGIPDGVGEPLSPEDLADRAGY